MNHSQFVYIKMDRGWCTSATRNIALIIVVMIKASFGPARVCSWGWACPHASWSRPFSTGTEVLSCIDRWSESVIVLWCMLRRLGVGNIILHEGRSILGKIYPNLTSIYFPCLYTFSFHWFGAVMVLMLAPKLSILISSAPSPIVVSKKVKKTRPPEVIWRPNMHLTLFVTAAFIDVWCACFHMHFHGRRHSQHLQQ